MMLLKKRMMVSLFCVTFLFFTLSEIVTAQQPFAAAQQMFYLSPDYSFKASSEEDIPIAPGTIVDSHSSPETAQEVDMSQLTKSPSVPLNRHARSFLDNFLNKESECLLKVKERSSSYFAIMDMVFRMYDLPEQLKYLAVIESKLKSKATSHVGARGLWQLMPVTARELGLKISHRHDERIHCYKSTIAAAKYLKALYEKLDDWLLVIAAYNCGLGPVYRAIRKSGSRNFWVMQYYLPRETRLHVKRFIGTHYFFEGQGSITTITKAETSEFLKAVEKYKSVQNSDAVLLNTSHTPEDNTNSFNFPKSITMVNTRSQSGLMKNLEVYDKYLLFIKELLMFMTERKQFYPISY